MITIALIEPKIPQNTGTIARTCAANHWDLHLVGEMGFSLEDKYLKRAGLDYWDYVSYTRHESVDAYLDGLQEKRCALLTTKSSLLYTKCTFQKGDVLIFGSETEGVPQEYHTKFKERSYTIPMAETGIRSLNLAVSVGIVGFEAVRQINAGK